MFHLMVHSAFWEVNTSRGQKSSGTVWNIAVNFKVHKNVKISNLQCTSIYGFRFTLYALYNLDESLASRG